MELKKFIVSYSGMQFFRGIIPIGRALIIFLNILSRFYSKSKVRYCTITIVHCFISSRCLKLLEAISEKFKKMMQVNIQYSAEEQTQKIFNTGNLIFYYIFFTFLHL